MAARYVLAPQAAINLAEIWLYIRGNAGSEIADRVESTILERIAFLSGMPGAGHHVKT